MPQGSEDSCTECGTGKERGLTRIPQAVFGDPSAPDAHVDPFDLSSPTAPSVAKRGVIGTVVSGVQQAMTEWGDSLDTTAATQTRIATDTRPRTPGSSLMAGATVLRAQGLTRGSTLGAVRRTLGLDTAGTAGHPQGTPVRDAVKKAGSDVNKAVTKFTDRVRKALSGGSDDAGE